MISGKKNECITILKKNKFKYIFDGEKFLKSQDKNPNCSIRSSTFAFN